MTNDHQQSPYLIDSTELRGTVGGYLNIRDLDLVINEIKNARIKESHDSKLYSLLSGQTIAVVAVIEGNQIEEAIRFFGQERVFQDGEFILFDSAICNEQFFFLLIDRFTILAKEDLLRIDELTKKVTDSNLSNKCLLYRKHSNDWTLAEQSLEFPTINSMFSLKEKTLQEIFSEYCSVCNTEFFSFILLLLKNASLQQISVEIKIASLSWKEIKNISILKNAICSGKAEVFETVSLRNKPELKQFDIYIPSEVTGMGVIADFLEIRPVINTFFKALPETSESRYRGFSKEDFLSMNLSEFFFWFKNHPKFRSLSKVIEVFQLNSISLNSRLESYNYQTAYLLCIAKELRKLREESRVFISCSILSETESSISTTIKEKLEALLQFYRAKIFWLENDKSD